MYVAVRAFYKKIQVRNIEHLPTDRPVIIASNHPNSFMDALVLSVLVKQKLNCLVRSDIFNNSFRKWFFAQLGFIPIYRIQEGADKLHKNLEAFDKCNQLLSKKESVLVFSEGICVQERRLRKLKKGTARIAFGAEQSEGFKMGLVVIPVGLNYSNPKKFRSALFINFGEAFEMTEFNAIYKQDRVKGVNEFTRHLEKKMQGLLVIIENKINDKLIEDIEEMYKKTLIKQHGLNNRSLENDFNIACKIADTVNVLYKNEQEKTEHIKSKIFYYLKEINALKLRDHLFIGNTCKSISFVFMLKDFLLLLLGLPLYIYGLINNYCPYKISYILTNKVVKKVEFHSSMNISIGTFLFITFYIIHGLVVGIIFSVQVLGIFLLLLPLSTLFCLYYWPFMKKTIGKGRLYFLMKYQKNKIEKLIIARKEIIDELEKKIVFA